MIILTCLAFTSTDSERPQFIIASPTRTDIQPGVYTPSVFSMTDELKTIPEQ